MGFEDGSLAWDSPYGLGEMTLWRDFDYVTSMIAGLRRYLFEHGTIPRWNYLLCGGKPELANPNSWAFAWPSIFAYALPPNAAVLAFVVCMSLLGLAGCYLLFSRWTGSRAGALAGATLFVFNGYFASHLNQGHVNFSLFHLVPWMLLTFDLTLERPSRGRIALSWLLAWMFFSTALPHGIIHFYPAFALHVAWRSAAALSRHGPRLALGPLLGALTPHLLGILAASYRLWPIARWQLDLPRQGVVEEAYGIVDVLSFSQRWIEDYRTVTPLFPGQVWGYWEYNNYIGPAAAGVALVAFALAVAPRRLGRRLPGLAVYAGVLFVLGLVLSLGNGAAGTPAHLFRHLPVLSGIRVFTRYQVLMTFGVALLVALAFADPLLRRLSRSTRRLALAAAALVVCGPPLVAALRITSRIQATSHADIAAQYQLPTPGASPMSVTPKALNHQTFFLERGYFVARCYEPLNLGARWMGTPLQAGAVEPLSLPVPPLSAPELDADTIRLRLPPQEGRLVALRMRLPPQFEANLNSGTLTSGLYGFDRGEPPSDTLTLRAVLPADRQGFIVSLLAFGLAVIQSLGASRAGTSVLPRPGGELTRQQRIDSDSPEAFQPPRHVEPVGARGWIAFHLRRALDLQVRTVHASVRAFAATCEDTVFDVGCGDMPYRGVFTSRGLKYVGIDFMGRDAFQSRASDVLLFDGEELPLADASVPHLLCTEVLEHVPTPQRLVDELHRVMRPGATALVTVPWSARYHHIPHDYFRYTPSALRQLFGRFRSVRIVARGSDWAVLYQKTIAVLARALRPPEGGGLLLLWPARLISTLVVTLPILLVLFTLANIFSWLGRHSSDDPLGYSIHLTK